VHNRSDDMQRGSKTPSPMRPDRERSKEL
jgi:hypothetical protein